MENELWVLPLLLPLLLIDEPKKKREQGKKLYKNGWKRPQNLVSNVNSIAIATTTITTSTITVLTANRLELRHTRTRAGRPDGKFEVFTFECFSMTARRGFSRKQVSFSPFPKGFEHGHLQDDSPRDRISYALCPLLPKR